MKNIALILASGTGSRCGLGFPKQFFEINGKSILEHTVMKFQQNPIIDNIYLVTNFEYIDKVKDILKEYDKVVSVVAGGKSRKESSYNGVFSIKETECNVFIHDCARPLVSDEIIKNCAELLKTNKAVCTVINSTDTVYFTDKNGVIKDIPNRNFVKRAQTPQCFKLSLIKKAHLLAKNDKDCLVTDDCGLIKFYNLSDIITVQGDVLNIKITNQSDLDFVKKYI